MIGGLWYAVAAAFGALVGSFLNVCIYRLPRGESIVWPGSHCPSCGASLASHDKVPVVSYLALVGRCRNCRAPISMRYPLVEAANAVGYVTILSVFGAGWPTIFYCLLLSALLVVAGTDLNPKIIPNV